MASNKKKNDQPIITKDCRMLIRSKEGVEIYNLNSNKICQYMKNEISIKEIEQSNEPSSEKRQWLHVGKNPKFQVVNPNNKYVYIQQPDIGVVVYNLKDNSKVCVLENSTNIQFLKCSPKGTYILTWERPPADGSSHLKVWDASTGKLIFGVPNHPFFKVFKREGWPYLQWTCDEKYAFLLVTSEIRIYNGNFIEQQGEGDIRYIDKINFKGIASMSLSPKVTYLNKETMEASYLFTTFIPKTKDKPARMSLHKYNPTTAGNDSKTKGGEYPSIVSKSLMQVEEIAVNWSPKGDSVLMSMQNSVDTSGESYYGSTTLFLFSSTCVDKTAINVPLPNNSTGPVLDVCWIPHPNKPPSFIVISGKMPTMTSLHHGISCEPTFLFGHGHRNTISWSEHGRFLTLAGFGNLAGSMTFWDYNKKKLIPHINYDSKKVITKPNASLSSCTVGYGWTPNSRFFFTSTCSPRMNVDNGIKLFYYNGIQIPESILPFNSDNYKPDKLLEVACIPDVPEEKIDWGSTTDSNDDDGMKNSIIDIYPDCPQDNPPDGFQSVEVDDTPPPATSGGGASANSGNSGKSKIGLGGGGRYVPPSARGKSTGGMSLAERMRREKEGEMMGATKITPGNKGAISKPSAASQQRIIPGMAPPPGASGKGADGSKKSKNAKRKEKEKAAKLRKKQQEEEEAALKQRAKDVLDAAAAQSAAAAPVDPEKRARKIKKTLKQIDELKTKPVDELNDDQKNKIQSENDLREELKKLGI